MKKILFRVNGFFDPLWFCDFINRSCDLLFLPYNLDLIHLRDLERWLNVHCMLWAHIVLTMICIYNLSKSVKSIVYTRVSWVPSYISGVSIGVIWSIIWVNWVHKIYHSPLNPHCRYVESFESLLSQFIDVSRLSAL